MTVALSAWHQCQRRLAGLVYYSDSSVRLYDRFCNRDIVARVQQVVCFAFHDSSLLLETCNEAKETRKIVTLFYLD